MGQQGCCTQLQTSISNKAEDEDCGGWSKNGPHSLVCLNTCSSVHGTVLGRYRRCGLVEGVVSLGVSVEISKAPTFPKPFPTPSLSPTCRSRAGLSADLCVCAPPSWTLNPLKPNCFGYGLIIAIEKKLRQGLF